MSVQNHILTEQRFSNGNTLVLRMLCINEESFFFVYLRCLGNRGRIHYEYFRDFAGLDEWDNVCEYYHFLKGN